MLNFDPNLKIPLLADQKPPELCSKYIFIQNWSNICTHICKKTWRAGRISLKFGVVSNQVVLRKTLENKNFLRPALLCANIYQIFFSHLDTRKYLLLFFQESVQLVPSLFSHPSASLLELQLNRAIKNVCLLWMINSDQIYARKWNWPNVVSKYLIWNNSYLPKMGGEVVILANSLISHFQWGLRHSAV